MAPNAELLNRTYDYITAHPGEWDQSMWARKTSCGTAYCFAGRAVLLAHPDAVFEFDREVIAGDEYEDAHHVLLPGESEPRPISELAKELLGLNQADADRLFDESNLLGDLAAMIEGILFAADPEDVG